MSKIEPILREDSLENRENAEGILKQLRLSLQLLASNARYQTGHFPPHSVVLTDEMALDFENWSACVSTCWQLAPEQAAALKSLDDFLREMSDLPESDFWTDEALFIDARWNEVRALARTALLSFGWSVEAPPPAS
jgi:hypothetical protein